MAWENNPPKDGKDHAALAEAGRREVESRVPEIPADRGALIPERKDRTDYPKFLGGGAKGGK